MQTVSVVQYIMLYVDFRPMAEISEQGKLLQSIFAKSRCLIWTQLQQKIFCGNYRQYLVAAVAVVAGTYCNFCFV